MEEELAQLTLRPFHLSNVDAFMLLLWAGDDRVVKFITCNVFTSKGTGNGVGQPICVDGRRVSVRLGLYVIGELQPRRGEWLAHKA